MMTEQIQSHYDLFVPTLLLILLGAFTKSAQFPFHFWLPNAMAGTHACFCLSAFGNHGQSRDFLAGALIANFAGAALYHNLVTFIGLFTLCMAAFFAIFKEDLKGLLAYSTISHLGLIMCFTRHWFTVGSGCSHFPYHQPRHL